MKNQKEQSYYYRNRRIFIPEGYLAVGFITGVHGLRGELKVEVHTDFPERFSPGNHLALGEKLLSVSIEASRMHKGHVLLTLSGIKNRNQAEELRNLWLFIEEDSAAELEDDTYWIHDIIGLTVLDEDHQSIGTVTDVIATGANDVYAIQPAGTINRGRELLVPAIEDVVRRVDLEKRQLIIRLQPGLIEE